MTAALWGRKSVLRGEMLETLERDTGGLGEPLGREKASLNEGAGAVAMTNSIFVQLHALVQTDKPGNNAAGGRLVFIARQSKRQRGIKSRKVAQRSCIIHIIQYRELWMWVQ